MAKIWLSSTPSEDFLSRAENRYPLSGRKGRAGEQSVCVRAVVGGVVVDTGKVIDDNSVEGKK